MRKLSLILIHVLAAAVPLFADPGIAPARMRTASEWPSEFNGIEVTPLALSGQELAYYANFPGEVARFQAGRQEIVMRWVQSPTRKLHPAADCLRGSGYRVQPLAARRDRESGVWGCVLAEKNGRRLHVCEQIIDAQGKSWYDVSSWYWAAAMDRSSGPWRAVTIAEPI